MAEYKYPYRMSPNTATVILVSESSGELLLGMRSMESDAYPGSWSLVGGFLDAQNETLEDAAAREVKEETGISLNPDNLLQLGTTSTVDGPDPRYPQIINTLFMAKVSDEDIKNAIPGDDISEVTLFKEDSIPTLAFDHSELLKKFW